MNLKAYLSTEGYHNGMAYLPRGRKHAFPFVHFLAETLEADGADALIFAYLNSHPEDSSLLHLIEQCGRGRALGMLCNYISEKLHAKSLDLLAYTLFKDDLEQFNPLDHVEIDAPEGKYFAFIKTDDTVLIIAESCNISIKSHPSDNSSEDTQYNCISNEMKKILSSHEGYSMYGSETHPILSFAEMLDYETLKLGHYSIYDYLTKKYPSVEALHIPMDRIMGEELCSYCNTRILEVLSEELGYNVGESECCWVYESEDAVQNYRIKLSKDASARVCEISLSGDLLPACDLGAAGCLILADRITYTTSKQNQPNDKKAMKTSLFAKDNSEYTVIGIPVVEDTLCLAVPRDIFREICKRDPKPEEESKVYKHLYLLKDIPYVPIWKQYMSSRYLLEITMNDYGIVAIKTTSIPIERI